MTATLYVHVGDGELRAEDAGTAVRIVAGNFEWTMLLENRLDCARWMKAIADADALFIRRKAANVAPLPLDVSGDLDAIPANRIGGFTGEECSDPPEESCSDAGCPVHGDVFTAEEEDAMAAEADDLEPLPQRTPAGPPEPEFGPGTAWGRKLDPAETPPWQAAMNAELGPEALAGAEPLGQLAPEPEDETDDA